MIKPTPQEMRAALETLVRGWAGMDVTDPKPGPDEDEDEGYAEGEDPWSVHARHQRTGRCGVRDCYQVARYRIRPWCVHPDGTTISVDPEKEPAAVDGRMILGDSVQWHADLFACSARHVQELRRIDTRDRAGTPDDDPLSARNTHYEVTGGYRYEPDDYDVPGALHPLAGALSSAHWWLLETIRATYARSGAMQTPDDLWRTVLARVGGVLALVAAHEDEMQAAAEDRHIDMQIDESRGKP